ncbi:MAG: RNA 2',3'-cyclic phosphodiesterase, partial [Chloroflexota bacterium]|nr:RNA 2',3'-cyclic phosphodiesterase [Chloroflexota bacterium]
ARHLPFYLTFRGLGVFPNIRNLRVLWMGIVEGREELTALQQDVENRLSEIDFPEEGRAFEPHLTLGRVKEPLSRAQMLFFSQLVDGYAPFQFGLVPVSSFQLMRSVLRPSGAVYSVLEAYQLGAALVQDAPVGQIAAPGDWPPPDRQLTLEDEFSEPTGEGQA